MIPFAITVLVLAAFAIFGLTKKIERVEAERDDAIIQAAEAKDEVDFYTDAFMAEADAHELTHRELERTSQAADDHYTALCVVLDAHARDIIFDPLGSDLIADPVDLKAVRP